LDALAEFASHRVKPPAYWLALLKTDMVFAKRGKGDNQQGLTKVLNYARGCITRNEASKDNTIQMEVVVEIEVS
jgi:hypothetical protein